MSAIDVKGRRVLAPCCGGRMMWADRQHPDVVFGDIRLLRGRRRSGPRHARR